MNVHQLSPDHWQVDSETTPGAQYDVHQDGSRWTCSCPQNAIKHRCCKHIAATWSFIKDCPACHGRGVIRLNYLVWYDETGERAPNELPCCICEGSGRREKPAALPSQDELKRVFA